MFKVGDLVRYNPAWCTPGELKYIHMVKEVGLLNPVTMQETRLKIVTLNSTLFLPPTEVVDDCMVESLGISIDDLKDFKD